MEETKEQPTAASLAAEYRERGEDVEAIEVDDTDIVVGESGDVEDFDEEEYADVLERCAAIIDPMVRVGQWKAHAQCPDWLLDQAETMTAPEHFTRLIMRNRAAWDVFKATPYSDYQPGTYPSLTAEAEESMRVALAANEAYQAAKLSLDNSLRDVWLICPESGIANDFERAFDLKSSSSYVPDPLPEPDAEKDYVIEPSESARWSPKYVRRGPAPTCYDFTKMEFDELREAVALQLGTDRKRFSRI